MLLQRVPAAAFAFWAAQKLNRNPVLWSVLAAVFPPAALLVAHLRLKRSVRSTVLGILFALMLYGFSLYGLAYFRESPAAPRVAASTAAFVLTCVGVDATAEDDSIYSMDGPSIRLTLPFALTLCCLLTSCQMSLALFRLSLSQRLSFFFLSLLLGLLGDLFRTPTRIRYYIAATGNDVSTEPFYVNFQLLWAVLALVIFLVACAYAASAVAEQTAERDAQTAAT